MGKETKLLKEVLENFTTDELTTDGFHIRNLILKNIRFGDKWNTRLEEQRELQRTERRNKINEW